uniref:Uncharacterized protein n=1 Tax=Zea mays TaxID=4577 RepID=A0A804NJQ0_MAIZE
MASGSGPPPSPCGRRASPSSPPSGAWPGRGGCSSARSWSTPAPGMMSRWLLRTCSVKPKTLRREKRDRQTDMTASSSIYYHKYALDVIRGETVVFLQRQQEVHEVFRVVVALLAAGERVLGQQLVEEAVPPLADALGLGADDPEEQVHVRQLREVVLHVEPAQEGGAGLRQLPEQLVPALLPVGLAEHGAAHEVAGVAAQQLRHVERRPRGRLGGVADPGHHQAHLLLPLPPLGEDHLGAEQVRVDHLPRRAPVLAVRREGHVRRVVADDVGDGVPRAGRQHVVVRAEHGLGGLRRGHHDGGHGADLHQHQPVVAVLGVEVAEGDVRVGADEVEVPDDGELPRRRRRQPVLLPFGGRRGRAPRRRG